MVSPSEDVELKEEIFAYNNIIISDSIIHNILPSQIKNISAW